MAYITFSNGMDAGLAARLWAWWPAMRRARQDELRDRIGDVARRLLWDLDRLPGRCDALARTSQRVSWICGLPADHDRHDEIVGRIRDLEHQARTAAQRLSYLEGRALEQRRKVLLALAAETDTIMAWLDAREAYWEGEQKARALPRLV